MEPLPTRHPYLAEPGRSFGIHPVGWPSRTPRATPTPKELDRITRIAGEYLDVAAVCATIVDSRGQLVVSSHGIAVPTALLITHALRRHLTRARSILVVPDASLDHRLAGSPTVRDGTVRACVGMSLRGTDGRALGSLVVMDPEPRRWTPHELDWLLDFSGMLLRQRSAPADAPPPPAEPVRPAFGRGILGRDTVQMLSGGR